ncbi:MAG: pilus assembly protein PilC, partial [Phormidesmis priestleyi]
MATYVVTGRSKTGKPVRQKVDAASQAEARTLIKEQGVHIQDIKESKGMSFSLADIQ